MKVDKDTRKKIIDYLKSLDDGHGSTDKEKIEMLDIVLNAEGGLEDLIYSSLGVISANQGSFGDGRSIQNAQRIIWTCQIVKGYM